ncbi:MAG TPA: NAD-dependent epimerase/dehydratase family protein, partial [Aldersonia sp.]
MRILVTGGAGFLGSHLCDRLVGRGEDVVCVDDFSTGHRSNVAHLLTSPRFSLREGDVRYRIDLRGSFDAVAHLASPASPAAYLRRPIFTLETGSLGTRNVLDFAASK